MPTPLHRTHLTIDGRSVPAAVRLNPRARRYLLRIDPRNGHVVIVRPARGSIRRALAFAEEQRDWIAARLSEQLPPVPFVAGAEIPLRGALHRIRHEPQARRGVWCEQAKPPGALPILAVSGRAEHLARRVHDWLRRQARADLTERCHHHAATLGLRPARVSVRDTTSRWGSCSSEGTLSFSWRLILAPPFVLDYVAAHETVHLRYMNHGRRFWHTVDRLTPDRTGAETWLKTHGPALYRYGLTRPAAIETENG